MYNEQDQLLVDAVMNGFMGLGTIDDTQVAEFAGFGDLPEAQKAAVGQKIKRIGAVAGLLKRAGSVADVTGSRTELLKRFPKLPQEIRKGLVSGVLQITEGNFHTAILLQTGSNSSDSTQELLLTSQTFQTGVTNLDRGMLPKGYYLLVAAIQYLFGDAPTVGTSNVQIASYGTLPAPLRNGSFVFKANGKFIVPEMSANVYDKTNRTDVDLGFFKMENPKLIEPQVSIAFDVKWRGLLTGFAAVPAAKVIFHGSVVAPY